MTEQEFAEAWREAHSSTDEAGHVKQEAALAFDQKTGTAQAGTASLLHSVAANHTVPVSENYHEAWKRYRSGNAAERSTKLYL